MGENKGPKESGGSSHHQAEGLNLGARGQKVKMVWRGVRGWEIKDIPTKPWGS